MNRPRTTTPGRVGIIFFGEDWGRHNSTGQYLARELSRRQPVLWVDSLGLRTPRLSLADVSRVASKLGRFLRRREGRPSGSGNLRVLTPLVIPYYRSGLVRRFNQFVLARLLRRACRAWNLDTIVVITACPASADIVAQLQAEAKVYYCADEYAEQPGIDPGLVRALEQDLLRHVHVVVASARRLATRKAQYHPDVRYLPHGVHFGHFSRAAREQLPCPADLRDILPPRLGFVGSIGEHIDFGIIDQLARELPEASLVMVGPVDEGFGPLPRRENIHYLGPRPHEALPAYLAHFDVCLMPYADSERIRNANPTKLREYLAAGCEVVATPVEEAEPLSRLFHTAHGRAAFVEQTKSVLKNTDRQRRATLSQSMADADWGHRAAELWDIIESIRRARPKDTPAANAVLEQRG